MAAGEVAWASPRAEPGKTYHIRKIEVRVNEIFEEAEDLGWFYRAANNIKPETREHVVRRELLFREGDEFDPFRIQESARFLRALPFLRNVVITPDFQGDVVDIRVSVQDTWTFVPFFSLSSGGGRQKKESFGVADSNVLGFGKRLEALYGIDEGREKIEGVYDDRRLFGTYQQLTVGHSQRSDGNRTVMFYGRPFRSLVEPYSWSVQTENYDLVGKLFSEGTERYIYRQKHDDLNAGFTVAKGEPEEAVRRYTLGYQYTSDIFSDATDQDFEDANVDPDGVSRDPELLASNRRFSGPSAGIQRIEPDFVSLNYVDAFDRVEDFNLGNELLVRGTYALGVLGSIEDAVLLAFNDNDGFRISDTSFVRGRIGATTRVTNDAVENTIVSSDVRYVNARGTRFLGDTYIGRYTDIAALSLDFGADLDKDQEFLLGAFSGLRGYEDRSFTGSQAMILTLEERVHMVDDVFHLVSLGGAAFYDVGGTSRHGFGDILDEELRSDVGVGLRLGFPRSSGGGVIRVDIAFPTRDGVSDNAWTPRLLITTGQSVTARLPNEATQNPGANVALKFLP